MSTLHLLRYNNYYNRIIKIESSLSDYQGYQVRYNGQPEDPNGNTAILEGVNFTAGDFVDTTQIVNWGGDLPDYLLVVENGNISSRWYVIDAEKTRGGQLLLTLHRDLVADYYTNLLSDNTAIFVEKAIIPSSNNLIFNSEDMSFNQIKTKETLLKDDTLCPWIVIYAARKSSAGEATTFRSNFTTQYPFIEITQQQYNDLMAWVNKDVSRLIGTKISIVEALNGKTDATLIEFSTDSEPSQDSVSFAMATGATLKANAYNTIWGNWEYISNTVLPEVSNLASSYIPNIMPDYYNGILNNRDKFLKYTPPGTTTSRYFRINITEQYNGGFIPSSYSGALETALNPLKIVFTNQNQVLFGNLRNANIEVQYLTRNLRFNLEEITEDTPVGDSIFISANRYHLIDAPYDMFCLPLSDNIYFQNSKDPSGFVKAKSNLLLNLSLANQLISDYSGVGQIYDAQILPYCPITDHLTSFNEDGGVIYDINDANTDAYTLIGSSEFGGAGYLLHATQSSFALNIDLDNPIVISDYKVESECDLYRLCSPNYAGLFEFNAAKNGGVATFNVKCTYKPFNPYIKLYPNFGRLYGNDYNDARGLICNGDFSLPTLTDQWKTFELSNKNYQASFDRQIQNIEVNNAVQKEREIWGVTAGVVGAGVQGGSAGLAAGGPIGAAVGAGLGSALSIAGGVRDIQLNNKLRNEAIDYARDQFGYQLGNIKALPQTLSRTSAYNIDNKYFPFLEYYTCTDIEKQALRDKIKYNGMTVMAIGTMKYYKDNYNGSEPMYFKGKLIRLDGFNGEYHILNALAGEIYKGVFI